MEKDRELRYRRASEVRADLERLKVNPSGAHIRIGLRSVWIAAAAVGLVSMAYLWERLPSQPTVSGYVQLTNDGRVKQPPLATDGSPIYFSEGSVVIVLSENTVEVLFEDFLDNSFVVLFSAEFGSETARFPRCPVIADRMAKDHWPSFTALRSTQIC